MVAGDGAEHVFFFGEDQGRYILTATPAETEAILAEAARAGVPVARIGVTGGEDLKLGDAAAIPLAALRDAHEIWLPSYMSKSGR